MKIDTFFMQVAGLTTLTAGEGAAITLNQANNDFGSVRIVRAGAVTLQDRNALDLAASAIGGALDLRVGGSLSDSGAVSVFGTTTIQAAGQTVVLDAGNVFTGATTITAGGLTLGSTLFGADLRVAAGSGGVRMGTTSVAGALALTSAGAVSGTAAIEVNGTTTLDTGTANVSLTHADNDFRSAVTVVSAGHLALADRNTLALAGAVTGYKTFASAKRDDNTTAIQVGDVVPYYIEAVDANGVPTGAYESGIGTYSAAATLTRTTVLRSSNADAAVSFAAGTKYVGLGLIGSKILQIDNELAVPQPVVPGSQANISTPGSGFAKNFFRSIANRPMPKWVGPTGVDQMYQDSLYDNNWCLYLPNNGTTVGLNYGIAWTSGGTVSHPTPATTAPAKSNQMKRTRWANVVTTTNQVLGLTTAAAAEKTFWRGNAAGLGGFFFHCRFIVELWPAATVRLFVGLSDQTTNPVSSDTLAGNCAGLWHDTTEAATVLNFVRRDGTTATKTAITLTEALQAGSSFDFFMYASPNGSAISYALYDIKNDVWRAVDQSITTNLPTSTAFLGPCAAMSNGTANVTVTTTALGIARLYCQSDY